LAVIHDLKKLPYFFIQMEAECKEMEQTVIREHKHVIVRAYVNNPPSNSEHLSSWCREVITSVGMKCIGGPLVVHSDMEGNAGYTAVAVLDFSHLAIHSWDEISPALIEFDLFSCKNFDIDLVLTKLNEFGIVSYSTLVVDRDDFDNQQRPLLRNVA
jgi:S-adenosylmethionine/arginine decarboxylase-like enzyme